MKVIFALVYVIHYFADNTLSLTHDSVSGKCHYSMVSTLNHAKIKCVTVGFHFSALRVITILPTYMYCTKNSLNLKMSE